MNNEKPEIVLKSAYEPKSPDDGFRVYIDRLWPRGRSHENFHYDLWDKTIAPSTELREWFHADPMKRWNEFSRRYAAELLSNSAFENLVKIISDKTKVTLLYSSHDEVHNNAIVVKECLINKLHN